MLVKMRLLGWIPIIDALGNWTTKLPTEYDIEQYKVLSVKEDRLDN